MKYCIDPGHGGADSGAVGPNGLRESVASLAISQYLGRGLLDSGHDVFYTRTGDVARSLGERCNMANAGGANVLVSVHCNAFSNPMAHGSEIWTSRGQTAADPIAERIFNSIAMAFPQLAMRADKTDGDSDHEAGFRVLVGSTMPAVLVECAFISNAIEEAWLRSAGWRMMMAGAITRGLVVPEVSYG